MKFHDCVELFLCNIFDDIFYMQWHSKGPAGPATAGARGAEGARQEEVVAVNPWPGAQTSFWRGAENRRYATVHMLLV